MSKLAYKLIVAFTVCTLTVALIIGGFSLSSSTDFIIEEVESKLHMEAEKYANKLSGILNRTEGIIDALAANLEVTFDYEKFKSDDAYFNGFKADLADVIRQTILESEVAQGLYFTFDPKLHESEDEIWYARQRDGQIVEVDVSDTINERDFSLPPQGDMLYFFEPVFKKKGVWTGPYVDKDINQNIVSFSRAVYCENLFLGVVGADVLSAHTTDIVSSMNVYKGGHSFLLDENLCAISHPTLAVGSHLLSKNSKELKPVADVIISKQSGVVEYKLNGKDQILGFSHLDNGWVLGIALPQAVAFAPVKSLTAVMGTVGIITIFAILIFAWIFSNTFSKPIVKEKDELIEQNREKDIMLTYKSRQAKMGEMVGNIAHQWKQPLNSINLILVNILDAYRYGELDEMKLEKSIGKADKIVKKMVETVGDFTNFLKPSKKKIVFEICEQISVALNLMEGSISQNDIKINFVNSPGLLSFGYPNEFAHVIFNVLNNARDAILADNTGDKVISIFVEEEENLINVKIFNPSKPILPEYIDKVFDPYFTTKDEADGTGLGLYICKVIVEQRMGGNISLYNMDGGVCCKVQLNRSEVVKENCYE